MFTTEPHFLQVRGQYAPSRTDERRVPTTISQPQPPTAAARIAQPEPERKPHPNGRPRTSGSPKSGE